MSFSIQMLKYPLNQSQIGPVIYETKGNVLWIADPANGKNRKTIEAFQKEWTGILTLSLRELEG